MTFRKPAASAPPEARSPVIAPDEIAVLVLSTRHPDYAPFVRAVREGWMDELAALGVKSYLYSGGHPHCEVAKDEIRTTVSDRLEATAPKLVSALDVLLRANPRIRLIYRTNLSSFVEPRQFLRFIQERQLDQRSYVGLVGTTTLLRERLHRSRVASKILGIVPLGRRLTFASGSGFFIGAEHARAVVHRRQDLDLIDDVMVARSLGMGPEAAKAPVRLDIRTDMMHRIPVAAYERMIERDILFHYRFKTNDRRRDAEMLHQFCDPAYRVWACTS